MAANKVFISTIMIAGSTDLEALSPHFQFKTNAQTADGMHLRNEMIFFMPQGIIGKFGNLVKRR